MSDTHMQIGKIVCPHCGYALDEADSEGLFYTEDGVETWCEKCDEEFTCYGSVTWYFTTKKGHVETARRAEGWYVDARTTRCPDHWPGTGEEE